MATFPVTVDGRPKRDETDGPQRVYPLGGRGRSSNRVERGPRCRGPQLEHPYLRGGHLMRSRPADATGPRPDASLARHAGGWGGLPDEEARDINVNPGLPVGESLLTVRPTPRSTASGRSRSTTSWASSCPTTAIPSASTNPHREPGRGRHGPVHFGGCNDNRSNRLPVMDGWDSRCRPHQRHL